MTTLTGGGVYAPEGVPASAPREAEAPDVWGVNVGPLERVGSVVLGAGLLGYGLARRKLPGLAAALIGGALVYRGMTGKSPIYTLLGLSTAAPERGVLFDRTFTVQRPRAEVYAFLQDLGNLSGLFPALQSVQVLPDGRSRWVLKGPKGFRVSWFAVPTEEREPEALAWSTMRGSRVEHHGVVMLKDAPSGHGTQVHLRLRFDVPTGSEPLVLSRLLGPEPEAQLARGLEEWKRRLQ